MKMNNLKTAIFCFFGMSYFLTINAQEMRAFGNYSMYYGSENVGTIRAVEAGIDYGDFPIYAFQLSASYLKSDSGEQEYYDYDNYVQEKLSTKGSAINAGAGIKVYNLFLDENNRDGFNYYIMPKVNLAHIWSKENFSSQDYFFPSNSFAQERSRSSWQAYCSVEIGYEFFLSDNNSNSITISASYNRINLAKGLYEIPHNNFEYGNHNSFGLGISFYLGVKNLYNKK